MRFKLLHVLLPILFVFLSLSSAFATSQVGDFSESDTPTTVTREDVELFINNITPEEYKIRPEQREMVKELKTLIRKKKKLTFHEVASVIDKYNPPTEKADLVSAQDSEEQENQYIALQQQFRVIDALAKEYYDYYKLHGKFPDDKELQSVGMRSVSTSDALKVLQGLGISYTEKQLAARLAVLGSLASLDGPMPVGDFIALLSGCVIFGYDVVSKYNNTATALANDIGKTEGRTYIKIVSDTIAISATTAEQIRKGNRHFIASLNYGGAGGIIVGNPITLNAAQLRAKNSQDTFSTRRTYAEQVVTIQGYSKLWESAHINTNYGFKPNNLPHWHLYKSNGEKIPAHHFHPWKDL